MKKILFFAALFCSIAISACGDDDEDNGGGNDSVQVSTENIEFTGNGGSASVTVTATHEWGATASASWIKLDNTSSTAKQGTVVVTAEANPTTQDREGTILFKAGTARATITVRQAAGDKAVYPAPEGYSLVWHDEFDTGSELSASNWVHEVQSSGWVNQELQNYVNHTSPGGANVTEIRDGNLRINCFKENGKIYSGRVYAHVSTGWQYGYFEARMKLPKGKGTWPAFWMMPVGNDWATNPWPLCGEIDIMEEVGVVPNEVSSSLHTEAYNHTKGTQKTHAMTIDKAEGEFHVYALEWTADAITTYVDGQVQLAVTKSQMGSDHTQWPFHYAFYPIFNLAWGGSWGGMNGVDESALPVTLEIDYLRVFQK